MQHIKWMNEHVKWIKLYLPKKKGGAWQDLTFQMGIAGIEGRPSFRGSCSFYIKNELKSEIFNDKKSL